jgi:hypothetical protein
MMENINAIDVLNVVMFIGAILVFIAGKLADQGTREIVKRTEEKRKKMLHDAERNSAGH